MLEALHGFVGELLGIFSICNNCRKIMEFGVQLK